MPVFSARSTTPMLLQALRHEQTADAWLAAAGRPSPDWDDVAVRAIVLGLAPQLHRRLQSWDLQIPPRAAAKLAVTYQAQRRRNKAILQQLEEILAACAGPGLRPVVLKGAHLAHCYYEEPGLRPMNDIDLLFRKREMPQVERLLTGLGYRGRHKAAHLGAGVTKHTSTFRRDRAQDAATPNPFLSADGDRTVEPHTSLEESWYGLRVDITPGVRDRSQAVHFGAQPARALAAEDLLLHLCVHFCFHLIMGAPAMVQLADLLVVSRDEELQWDEFVERARASRATPYALAALTLSERLLGAPLPQGPLARLRQDTPGQLRRRIARMDLQTLIDRTQQKPWSNTWQRILHGFRARAEAARWAPDLRARWRVWRTALHVMRSDTGRELLEGVA
jgi:hypothetical protein